MRNQQATGTFRPAPSPQFLAAAQQVALAVGLDVGRVVEGDAMEYEGVAFWLHHHGPQDPSGIVVVIEMGRPASDEEQSLQWALQYNLATPATQGHYALLPDGATLVYCLRIDSERNANPANAILSFVTIMAAQKAGIAGVLGDEVEKFKRKAGTDSAATSVMLEASTCRA